MATCSTAQAPSAPGRDLALDGLRGLLLLLIFCRHMPGHLRDFLNQPFGFVTGAEGFVFLSGFVAGKVYGRRLARGESIASKAWKRAGLIFLHHLGILVAIWLMVNVSLLPLQATELPGWYPAEATWRQLLLGTVFLFQPCLADVLPMYCLFMLLLPGLLGLIYKQRWIWLYGLVTGLWLLAQLGVYRQWLGLLSGLNLGRGGDFDLLAWQLLFVAGLILGSRSLFGTTPAFVPPKPLKVVLWVGLLSLCLLRHWTRWDATLDMDLHDYIDKQSLGPLRVLNYFVLLGCVSMLWPWLRKLLSWHVLVVMGQQTLLLFSIHIPLTYLVRGRGWVSAEAGEPQRLLVAVALVGLSYLVALASQWIQQKRRSNAERKTAPWLATNA